MLASDDGGVDWRSAADKADSALSKGHAATLAALRELDKSQVDWPTQASMYILRNYTTEPLPQYVRLAGFRRGLDIRVASSGYDTAPLEARDPASALREGKYDVILLALWLDELREGLDAKGVLDARAVTQYISGLLEMLLAATESLLIVSTVLPPLTTVGISDRRNTDTINNFIRSLPEQSGRVLVTDLADMTAEAGYQQTLDSRLLLSSKAPLRTRAYRDWATDLVQIVASLKGKAKKVIALDCDNTLWGGIIGEDGLGGIALNPNELPGRAYHLFQAQLVTLQRQGVLLALCSRNNEADVLQVLDQHPHCLIRRDALAGWEINWRDKAESLERLARTLRLGLDSFVFIDDNPMECGRVKQALPEVDVLQAGVAASEILGVLPSYDGWPRLAPTAADLHRTASYQADMSRQHALNAASSIEDFLEGLDLEAEVSVIEDALIEAQVARIVQLSQRTNQFNMTGRRYSLGQLRSFCDDQNVMTLTLSAKDKFGDYGVTGAAVVIKEGAGLRLDGLFLSCRVLGRQLEVAFLSAVVRTACSRWKVPALDVEYVPTQKNAPVLMFLRDCELVDSGASVPTEPLRISVCRVWADAAWPAHVRRGGAVASGSSVDS